jgi:hypothetical protein
MRVDFRHAAGRKNNCRIIIIIIKNKYHYSEKHVAPTLLSGIRVEKNDEHPPFRTEPALWPMARSPYV